MSSENTTRFHGGTSDRCTRSLSNTGIFLGGPAGAGKTALTEHLTRHGWHGLDMDGKGTNRVLELLDAPADHPSFQRRPLVVEGGFLEEAPRFRSLIERLGLTTFWLTGTKDQLTRSRLGRMAEWDDRDHILRCDWIGMIERYRKVVPWDYEIKMWRSDGQRKTFDQVEYEILGCLVTGVHRTASW